MPAPPSNDLDPRVKPEDDKLVPEDDKLVPEDGEWVSKNDSRLDPLALRYLDHVRFEKRLAERTCTLYRLDLERLTQMAQASGVALLQVQPAHIRRWVAQMHGAGRSGRGIALILSGWRGFYAWLGREGLIASNPVQGVRAPKAPKPLPKALGVDEAVQLAEHENPDDDP